MLQIVVRSRARLLNVLDSQVTRMTMPAINEGAGAVPAGHYKLGPVKRRERSTWEGPGRIGIHELGDWDRNMLSSDPRVHGIAGVALSILGVVAPIGTLGGEHRAILGGSTSYGGIAFANFQPLTPAPGGIRIHNAQIEKLMARLDSWLAIDQLAILTVLEG